MSIKKRIQNWLVPEPPRLATKSAPFFATIETFPRIGGNTATAADPLQMFTALKNAYAQTPHVQGVLKYMARAFTRLKFREVGPRGSVNQNSMLSLLDRPNPLQGRTEFLEQLYIGFKLFGNAYFISNNDNPRLASTLYVAPAPSVRINTTGFYFSQNTLEDLVESYTVSINGTPWSAGRGGTDYAPSRVCHFVDTSGELLKNDELDTPIYGEPALYGEMAAMSVLRGVHNTMDSSLWHRGAQWLFSSDQKPGNEGADVMTPDERDDLLRSFRAKYGTTSGQSSVMFTNAAINATKLSQTLKDYELGPTEQAALASVCDALGFPVGLLAASGGSAFDNGGQRWEMERWLYENTILPDAAHFAQEIKRWLKIPGEIEVLTDGISVLQENIVATAEKEQAKAAAIIAKLDALERLAAAGYPMGREEARVFLGLA